MSGALSRRDLERLGEAGISVEEARRQLALLASPPPPLELRRPAVPGDGIARLGEEEQERLVELAERAASRGRVRVFVPASGAATRMFAAPLLVLANAGRYPDREALEHRAAEGDGDAEATLELLGALRELALWDWASERLARGGREPAALLHPQRWRNLLEALLGPDGLGAAALPKALLPFHRAAEGVRTPFEEHLREAVGYAVDAGGRCRLTFTVAPEHRGDFEAYWRELEPVVARRTGRRFEVGFSVQEPATQTLALDADGRPARDGDGELLLRPGGHGALIGNLEAVGGDLVAIKNIDNIQPDRARAPTIRWKKVLLGCLVSLQERLFPLLEDLEEGDPKDSALEAAHRFAREELGQPLPDDLGRCPADERHRLLYGLLHRPLRIAGMVRNQGEPGGGPFWVADPERGESLQIVEAAQVARDDPGQALIWEGSTHFNPVDLACGLRDHRGDPYPLADFVDPEAVFIADKAEAGRPIRALERPGLWNGAMGRWSSVFVEVPEETFAPVKTIFDLLRPEHRA